MVPEVETYVGFEGDVSMMGAVLMEFSTDDCSDNRGELSCEPFVVLLDVIVGSRVR